MGAVIVVGAVVVGGAIMEALDGYELRGSRSDEVVPVPQAKTASQDDASANRKPKLEPSGQDWFSPVPPEHVDRERRPECRPVPVPHAGGDDSHNECADKFPPNRYPGMDVRVGGVLFDALQVGARVLWEIKTHRFDTYSDFIRDHEIETEIAQLRDERQAARACGYDFVIGVSTQAHKEALFLRDSSFKIVVTGCER
ncbi:DUF6310 domain-containing protein [Corallococcus terminator]